MTSRHVELRPGRGRATRPGQRGYVAAILLVLVTLGALAGLLAQLNSIGIDRPVDEGSGSGLVLNDVRESLLAWSASHRDRPGGLPCPDINNDGFAEPVCDSESSRLGLLPWRTLGLATRPVADGEPLWYAVAPAARVQDSYPAAGGTCPAHATGTGFAINPDSFVELPGCVDRQLLKVFRPGASGALVAGDAVAAVLAPGVPLGSQTRPVGTVDVATPSRYFEGRNAAVRNVASAPPRVGENTFDTPDYSPDQGTNDRIAVIRAGELLDVVEPAVEQRLQGVAFWDEVREYHFAGAAAGAGFPFLPSPVPFSNPATDAAVPLPQSAASPLAFPYDDTSPGAALPTQGLLPVGLPESRLQWTFNSILTSTPPTAPAIAIASAVQQANRDLAITFVNTDATPATFAITLALPNAGRAFLLPTPLPAGTALVTFGVPVTASVAAGGVYQLAITAQVATTPPGGTTITVAAPRLNPALSALASPPIAFGPLSPTAWFMRNQWYRFVYYAAAPRVLPNHGPGPNLASCATPGCLTIRFPVSGAANASKDVALLFMGRALAGQNRATAPNLLSSYLDTTENTNGDTVFEYRSVRNVANDRVAYDPR